ncbi:MAG: hypothetical protein KBT33_03855 [Prevotellaceae bacterium]|nr:hypothetical protein [Candidatus Minthosoma equi]
MNEQENIYELINISIELDYELLDDNVPSCVCEDDIVLSEETVETTLVERDSDGIPMGQSMEEIKEREAIIDKFLREWSTSNSERKVFNSILNDFIYVRAISIVEAKEHSSKSYKSTRALLHLDEVLEKASPIKRVPKKSDNKNQREFVYFLVMMYKHQEIGTIKLTVGVKKNMNKIQYGISALKPEEPLVDYSKFTKNKKKRSSHK